MLCEDVYYPPAALRRDSPLPSAQPHQNIQGVCPQCRPLLPQRVTGYCPLCGAIYAVRTMVCTPCLSCLQKRPPWDRFLFYGVYDSVLSDIVKAAKFRFDRTALGIAGELLCLASQPIWHEKIDVIIPVPLHISRLRERGGNQCVEMARPLAKLLDVPMRFDLLERVRNTPHQLGLDARARRRNLDHAFMASPACKGMHVLLVDDIMTTGTTVRRCTEALRAVGVASVTVLVVARTRGH